MKDDRSLSQVPFLLQSSSQQIWMQAVGRSLYQAGYGTIQFYIPLIFVNQVGLSATTVGIGIGSGSLAGIAGHFLGGYLADSPLYGRKRALLFAALLSILAGFILALTQNLPLLVIANLIMGLSAGCYWTAADAAVVDVTPAEQRHKAFALMGLADSLGSGLGVWGGGILLASIERSQTLFLFGSVVLLIFLGLIQVAINGDQQYSSSHANPLQGFAVAFGDRSLKLFMLTNILFTTFIALVTSTLPLYFTSIVSISVPNLPQAAGASLTSIANLYTWCYVVLGAVLQLPLVQLLGSLPKVRILMISMSLWGVGFLLLWATGIALMPFIYAVGALSLFSIATVIYRPFATTIVAELAPESLRGIYLAISYQCWSIGYFIGPVLGGWAMDRPRTAHTLWLVVSISTIGGLVILYLLSQSQSQRYTPITEEIESVPKKVEVS